MYAAHFGLSREPFSIAPDPRYLFMSERHREALAHLLYGIRGGGGFVLLTGEIGAGKTTVCRAFLERIPKRCHVAYVFNPKLTVPELLRTVCDEFGLPPPETEPSGEGVKVYIDALNEFLLRTHALGHHSVLIIDEAQNLAAEVLEQLRLLTNLETSERKLLQIILIGQPELRDMLARPELEQLAQRVIARYHLQALSEAETAQYIAHRLAVAGLADAAASPFPARTVRRIHRHSRGVPRRINLLCDRALLGAYASENHQVSEAMVDQAADEVFGLASPTTPRPEPGKATAPRRGLERVPAWGWALMGGFGLGCFGLATGLAWWQATHASNPAQKPSPVTPVQVAPSPTVASRSASHTTSDTTSDTTSRTNSPSTTGLPTPPATAPAQPLADAAQLNAWLAQAPTRERTAWTQLAPLWQLKLDEREPCLDAARQQAQCFKSSGGLALIGQLGRPCILYLFDPQGQAAYALLTGLGPRTATLRAGDTSITVAITDLAKVWRGEFATLWRSPPGYRKRIEAGQSGPAVNWLAQRMAQLHQEPAPSGPQRYEPALQARVHAFQIAQGIKPDGMAGAMTLMQLNRATGVDEPRLAKEP